MQRQLLAIGLALSLAAFAAVAQKKNRHFADEQRGQVRAYYEEEFRRGACPPGLAKKQNGCMPPGRGKKWRIGKSIPAGVVIYDVPPELQIRIGLPPAGHRYVRVAADILLVAIGTKVVVDAVHDLGRL